MCSNLPPCENVWCIYMISWVVDALQYFQSMCMSSSVTAHGSLFFCTPEVSGILSIDAINWTARPKSLVRARSTGAGGRWLPEWMEKIINPSCSFKIMFFVSIVCVCTTFWNPFERCWSLPWSKNIAFFLGFDGWWQPKSTLGGQQLSKLFFGHCWCQIFHFPMLIYSLGFPLSWCIASCIASTVLRKATLARKMLGKQRKQIMIGKKMEFMVNSWNSLRSTEYFVMQWNSHVFFDLLQFLQNWMGFWRNSPTM